MTTPSEAKDFAIVMAFEAFRIALFGTTEKHKPDDVLRWMRLMLKQQPERRRLPQRDQAEP